MNTSFYTQLLTQLKQKLPENFELLKASDKHYIAPQVNKNLFFHTYKDLANSSATIDSVNTSMGIHIYEDQWQRKPEVILSRILNNFGFSQKLMARKMKVVKLTRIDAVEFLEENHLWGEAKAAYYYGLIYQNKIYMLASFSKSRVMTDGDVYYRSYELIRLASLKNYMVIGGFQKLLRHFINEKNVVHLMTYLDLNFGDGRAFEQFGFKKTGINNPQKVFIHLDTHKRYNHNPTKTNYSLNNILTFETNSWQKMILDLR